MNSFQRWMLFLGTAILVSVVCGFGVLAFFEHKRDVQNQRLVNSFSVDTSSERMDTDGIFLVDLETNLTITANGKTITPSLIRECFGFKDGTYISLTSLEEKRKEILEYAPNIREISISPLKPNKLDIVVTERTPIAKVGPAGRVVDEDGVIFVRYAGTSSLPLITGLATTEPIQPGARLQGNALAAIRLASAALEMTCPLQIVSIDASREDCLELSFSGDRHASLAWAGMNSKKHSDAKMRTQLEKLLNTMKSDK